MSNTSPQCQIGDHSLCKVVSKSGIRCACECHLTEQERAEKRATEKAAFHAAVQQGYIPTYGPGNADMERQFEADTGIKKIRSDRGMDYYDFADLAPNYISSACDPRWNHQHGPCNDKRCHCACHQPTSTGHALTAPEPEIHKETTTKRTCKTCGFQGGQFNFAPSGNCWKCEGDLKKIANGQMTTDEQIRQLKKADAQRFADIRKSACYTTSGRYQAGQFAIIGASVRSQQVLLTLEGSTWVNGDEEHDAGDYTTWYEPTEAEKQSAEYQKLAAQLAADLADEIEATKRAQRNSEDPEVVAFRAELDAEEAAGNPRTVEGKVARMGRPPVDERKELQGVMLEPRFIEQVEELARKAGITKSAWMREVILKALGTN